MGRTSLSQPAPSLENGFALPPGFPLDRTNLQPLLTQLADAITALQGVATTWEALVDAGTTQALAMVAENVAPQIAAAQATLDQLNEDVLAAQAQIAQLIAGGVPASAVTETATRVFVTPAQRSEISSLRSDLIVGLAAAGDALEAGLARSAPAETTYSKDQVDDLIIAAIAAAGTTYASTLKYA